MAPLPYRFLINSFLVVTQNSYKKVLSIGLDHKARLVNLQGDPEIAAILATFDPILQSYIGSDQNLQAAEGTYEGKTKSVEDLFDDLNKIKLPYWEGQIRSVYPEGTPGEINLFPDKRKPFQSGTYDQRISAIKVLGDKAALDASPVVVAVSANILAFWTQIEGARALQQSDGEAATATLRNLRENARVYLCQELYGDLGTLMHKHRANPLDIDQYFDFSYLRDHNNGVQHFQINPNAVLNLADNLQPGDITEITMKNTSDEAVTVVLYFASSISEQPTGVEISFNQGEEKVVTEADLGMVKPFLNVFNQSGHIGSIRVKGL